jgi:hypothetical protein
MASELMKNLGEVKQEARSMLTTLEAVKGPHYATTVRSLLLIKQIAMIGSLLCDEASKVDKAKAAACAYGLSESLCVVASSLQSVGAITDEDWTAMTKDAIAMGDSVDGLIRTAVDTSNAGSGFGGKDAE